MLELLILSFTLTLVLSGRVFAPEDQKAWLRMYATDSIYVGTDPDPWITESYVVYSGPTSSISVGITVDNIKKDANVYEIVVPIVTNNTSVISSILADSTTIFPSSSWKTGILTMTADDGYDLGALPPHGVYNDPTAYWIEYRSHVTLTGDGTPGESMGFTLTVNFNSPDPGNVKIHLDAYGWTEESEALGQKKPVIIDDRRDAVFAPFSHDITIIVPELTLPLLAVTSLGLCGYLFLKRKQTRNQTF